MSAAHWHLALNHIPLLGILFGAILLAYGAWRGQEEVQKASLGLLAVAGLGIIAVYLTGEPAEEIVEGVAGVSHDAIEAHEEFGWYALIAGIATGGVALGSLIYGLARRHLVRWTVITTLVLAVVSTGVIGYTANLGGQIHHPEIRGDAPTQAVEATGEHEEEHE